MLKSVEGVFRNGKVELLEPAPTQDASRVVITFLPQAHGVDLASRRIDTAQAVDLRARLRAFEDWDRAEMDVYDEL